MVDKPAIFDDLMRDIAKLWLKIAISCHNKNL
jgi:hypothetical protein